MHRHKAPSDEQNFPDRIRIASVIGLAGYANARPGRIGRGARHEPGWNRLEEELQVVLGRRTVVGTAEVVHEVG
jgi:hypothetical protein